MSILANQWLKAAIYFAAGAAFTLLVLFLQQNRSIEVTATDAQFFGQISGKELVTDLSRSELSDSPSWRPGASLPLTLEDAVGRATEALQALVQQPKAWRLEGMTLQASEFDKFYYVALFESVDPQNPFDRVQIVVYFNGRVSAPKGAPNNSFKPSPLRGLVQVLASFTCPRPQSGPA